MFFERNTRIVISFLNLKAKQDNTDYARELFVIIIEYDKTKTKKGRLQETSKIKISKAHKAILGILIIL